jgi:hypothetical protein
MALNARDRKMGGVQVVQHTGKVRRFLLHELWDDLTDAQYLLVDVRTVSSSPQPRSTWLCRAVISTPFSISLVITGAISVSSSIINFLPVNGLGVGH